MLSSFAGTELTAKPCLQLDKHRKFVWCDLCSERLNATEADPLLAFVCQRLSLRSNIISSDQTKAVENIFNDYGAALLTIKKASVSEVQTWLNTTNVLPAQILHFSAAMTEVYLLYRV